MQVAEILHDMADSAGCYLRTMQIDGRTLYFLLWKNYKVGSDGCVGHVLLATQGADEKLEKLLLRRFEVALEVLNKHEPEGANG